jgi:hypothetical protein
VVSAVVGAEAGAGDLEEVPAGAWFGGKGWAFSGCGFLSGEEHLGSNNIGTQGWMRGP